MTISFLKQGAASVQLAQQAQADQQNQSNGSWRFGIKKGEKNVKITFVDGDLIEVEGIGQALAPPRYYEHTIPPATGGKAWRNFVCPQMTVPDQNLKCPLCAAGDRPSLVSLFTVIDHRATAKGDKTYKDQKRLFVAKPLSMEYLTKIAIKRKGLAGATFDVERIGDQSAGIGSMFDFVDKHDIEELQAAFTHEVDLNGTKQVMTYFTPLDYEAEVKLIMPEEMLKMGLGSVPGLGQHGNASTGNMMSPGGTTAKKDYSKNF